MAALSLSPRDPVSMAVENYGRVGAYSVTLDSKSGEGSEKIRYYYKRPGYVRMDFIEPHNGAVLVYDPVKKEVFLRPFSLIKSFVLHLNPDDRLIRSSGGHTVAESDLGALFKRVVELQKDGKTEVLGNEEVGGRPAVLVKVEGSDAKEVDGIHSYTLWLDKTLYLPLKVISYNARGKKFEEVVMDDLKVNVDFPADFFSLE